MTARMLAPKFPLSHPSVATVACPYRSCGWSKGLPVGATTHDALGRNMEEIVEEVLTRAYEKHWQARHSSHVARLEVVR